MKKTLFIAMMALVMASCSKSPEQIAQQLIKKTFTEIMDDPSSYEVVGFGSLDSTFTTLEDNVEYVAAYDAYQNYRENYEFDEARVELEKAIAIKESFKSEFKGWKMSHSFRCKNAFGAVVLNEVDIYFNKELTEIVGRGEIK